jgi:hypothetical protein
MSETQHLCDLVLRHQMLLLNYFVNSFYSGGSLGKWTHLSSPAGQLAAVAAHRLSGNCSCLIYTGPC